MLYRMKVQYRYLWENGATELTVRVTRAKGKREKDVFKRGTMEVTCEEGEVVKRLYRLYLATGSKTPLYMLRQFAAGNAR